MSPLGQYVRQMSSWPVIVTSSARNVSRRRANGMGGVDGVVGGGGHQIMKHSVSKDEDDIDDDDDNKNKQPVQIDELQVYLLSIVLLFSPEGIADSLENADVVSHIQEYYLTLLHRYLTYRYSNKTVLRPKRFLTYPGFFCQFICINILIASIWNITTQITRKWKNTVSMTLKYYKQQ